MTPQVVDRLVCYFVHSGVIDSSGGCSYENGATYNDWEDVVTDIKAALDAHLQVMIEPTLMTPAEFETQGPDFPTGVNPLLGGTRSGR